MDMYTTEVKCMSIWMCECMCLYMGRHICKILSTTSNRKPNLTNDDHEHKNIKYVLKVPEKKAALGFLSNSQIQQELKLFLTLYSTILSPRDFGPEDSLHGTRTTRVAQIMNTHPKPRGRW